jgi:hypothetical protein
MSAISDARDELVAALELAGVDVTDPRTQLAVPGALIRPGDPWLEPAAIGGGIYALRESVLLVAGKADRLSSLEALESLANAAIPAIRGLNQWTSTGGSRAKSMELYGATYLITELVADRLIQL